MIQFNWRPAAQAILTPCIGVCNLDARGLCEGCWRTADEIARWGSMSDPERQHLMLVELPAREHPAA